MLYFAASSWLWALSFDPRPTLPTSIAIEDFKRQLRGELDALQAWKWSRGAGHQTSLSMFELLCWDVKEVRCPIFKILYLFQQGVTCRCFMVPESLGDDFFSSKLMMMISCLQWFLRSLTVLSISRKCTNCEEITLLWECCKKIARHEFWLPATHMDLSFCPCFFCGACWDARLYQSFVKTLKVGFLARWLSET